MSKQNYSNYIRYYAPHHFIFLPMMTACIITGIVFACKDDLHRLEWILFAILSFTILYLAIMLRQHYALGNQDRIVRLEFRVRYLEIFHENPETIEEQLSFAQIAALRFAYDEEFAELLKRTLDENLSADVIKKSIKNWKTDTMRL